MFGLSFGEILLIAALALIFIGPKQLPEVARMLGRTLGELKRAMNDMSHPVGQMKSQARDYILNMDQQDSAQHPTTHKAPHTNAHVSTPDPNQLSLDLTKTDESSKS